MKTKHLSSLVLVAGNRKEEKLSLMNAQSYYIKKAIVIDVQ